MSRLGNKPILCPSGVEAKIEGSQLSVKGPKGLLTFAIPAAVIVTLQGSELFVSMREGIDVPNSFHGLYRALVSNLVEGVAKGFEKRLSLIGVGYRAAVQGKDLDLQLGYSHPTKVAIPAGIQVVVDKGTTIVITGADKQVVGHFAAQVRAVRPPEPYKGKGVRYEGEVVRKKAGKAAKGKAA